MIRPWLLAAGAVAAIALAAPASADPCRAKLPSRAGDNFAGEVRYVGDGDSLCIGSADDPATWIEVRLADFDAPELGSTGGELSRDVLIRTVRGRSATCIVQRVRQRRTISYDRVIAICEVGGVRIGDLVRRANAPEGGR